MDVYCSALKKDGDPCPYKGKHVHPTTKQRFCGHHYKAPPAPVAPVAAASPPAPSKLHIFIPLIRDVEPPARATPAAVPATAVTAKVDLTPWKTRGLPDPEIKLLRTKVLKKLRQKLCSGPSQKSDSTGHIYVYSLASENGRNYWKIGMTTQTVKERQKQWQSKHGDGHTLVLKKSYEVPVKATKFLERVIHLYLDHRRMYRYPISVETQHLLVSIWSATGVDIQDKDWKIWEKSGVKKSAAGKMIEWFCLPWEDVSSLIDALLKHYSAAIPALL